MIRIGGRAVVATAAWTAMAAIAAVFAGSALGTDRGLASLEKARETEARLDAELAALDAERARLANLVARLSPESLDAELLDERARVVLGHARPDEILIRP
ncbi:MAG: septum formation initiator family protein [Paracoccaceae bacterium]